MNRSAGPHLEATDHSLFSCSAQWPLHRVLLPVCGSIIAVVGEEVKVQLPEDMQGDAAVRGRHIMIGFSEHGIEAV